MLAHFLFSLEMAQNKDLLNIFINGGMRRYQLVNLQIEKSEYRDKSTTRKNGNATETE